jgi:hypothetical protein
MLVYSKILNKYYDSDKGNLIYMTNFEQVYKYLNASDEVASNLVDILYAGTRKDCLTFVFKKTPLMRELYRKWNAHEL